MLPIDAAKLIGYSRIRKSRLEFPAKYTTNMRMRCQQNLRQALYFRAALVAGVGLRRCWRYVDHFPGARIVQLLPRFLLNGLGIGLAAPDLCV